MPQWVRWVGRLTLLGLAIVLVWRLRDVVLTFLLALLVMAALRPIVNFLSHRGVPRLLGVFACYLVLAALGAVVVWYLVPAVLQQASGLEQRVHALIHGLGAFESEWQSWRRLLPFLPAFGGIPRLLVPTSSGIATGIVGVAGRLLTLVVHAMSVFLLSFFFLWEGDQILAEVLRLFPSRVQREAPPILERVGDQVGLYALGQFVEMVIVGILDGVGMRLLGVHFPVLLGVLAGLSDVIPYFGPLIAAVPAVLVGLSQSLWLALYALGVYLVIHLLEANFLNPYVVGRFVGLRPIWVVTAVLVGDAVMGIAGMALAVPAATVIAIVIRELDLPWSSAGEAPGNTALL